MLFLFYVVIPKRAFFSESRDLSSCEGFAVPPPSCSAAPFDDKDRPYAFSRGNNRSAFPRSMAFQSPSNQQPGVVFQFAVRQVVCADGHIAAITRICEIGTRSFNASSGPARAGVRRIEIELPEFVVHSMRHAVPQFLREIVHHARRERGESSAGMGENKFDIRAAPKSSSISMLSMARAVSMSKSIMPDAELRLRQQVECAGWKNTTALRR